LIKKENEHGNGNGNLPRATWNSAVIEPELFPICRPWFVALNAVDVAIVKAFTDAIMVLLGKPAIQPVQLNEQLATCL
jgi:hypothetical protein